MIICSVILLILHALSPDQSAAQCKSLALSLSEKRTVYTMDLLGCGRSAKPPVTYSNFLYVLDISMERMFHVKHQHVIFATLTTRFLP